MHKKKRTAYTMECKHLVSAKQWVPIAAVACMWSIREYHNSLGIILPPNTTTLKPRMLVKTSSASCITSTSRADDSEERYDSRKIKLRLTTQPNKSANNYGSS